MRFALNHVPRPTAPPAIVEAPTNQVRRALRWMAILFIRATSAVSRGSVSGALICLCSHLRSLFSTTPRRIVPPGGHSQYLEGQVGAETASRSPHQYAGLPEPPVAVQEAEAAGSGRDAVRPVRRFRPPYARIRGSGASQSVSQGRPGSSSGIPGNKRDGSGISLPDRPRPPKIKKTCELSDTYMRLRGSDEARPAPEQVVRIVGP
jgi:hypothetical protein